MAYLLKSVTIRADNSPEGMERIAALWRDVASGSIPLLFDSGGQFQPGISPISRYDSYESDDTGAYDLSILGVTPDFFAALEEKIRLGLYKKYEAKGDSLEECARLAWEQVWADQRSGVLRRAFDRDYESTVPADFTKDGTAHCYLYISITGRP